jgi:endonuclease III
MKNKLVMILERSSENLSVKNDSGEIVLEGVFAQFGVENNNQRIYEEAEYLPHLQYLNEKIRQKRLVGELDHPEKFDISLSKVSHVIESLEYNKDKRQLIGRVKLLNTPSGRIAKELVESGVPISISSRAAGLVENNKKVKIKKIFTYDLVADPGFENAVLNRINESLGIENEFVGIYEVPQESYADLEAQLEGESTLPAKTNETKTQMTDYVTSEELNTYSLILKEEIEGIHKKLTSLSENISQNEMKDTVTKITESLGKMEGYVNYVSQNVDNSIQYSEYVAEKLDKVISYVNYLAETLNDNISHTENVENKTDKIIQYSEYLKEQIENGIKYSNYLKECIEQGVAYTEYVAEKTDSAIGYAEAIAENANRSFSEVETKLDESIEYAEYLGETLDKGIAYAEYIGEQAQAVADYTEFVFEKAVPGTKTKKESETEKSTKTDYSTLSESVDNILAAVKKQEAEKASNSVMEQRVQTLKNNFEFFNSLNEQKQAEFMLLEESKKQKVLKAIKESGCKTSEEVIKVWEAALAVNETEKWLTEAPAEYKKIFESLSEAQQQAIRSQAQVYRLETPYQIKNFWETRTLTPKVELQTINESNNAGAKANPLGYNQAYFDSLKAQLEKKKF